jgi:hypothetical protein
MKFNGVQITEESIHACRQWFIDNQQACITGALNGTLGVASHVNVTEYIEACQRKQDSIEVGEQDHTFTFMQRAYYIQTGESVALLS